MAGYPEPWPPTGAAPKYERVDYVKEEGDEASRPAVLTNRNRDKGIPKWDDIKHIFESEEATVKFLIDEKILDIPTHCPRCKEPIRAPNKTKIRCQRQQCRLHHGEEWTQSIFKGSFFENARGGKCMILLFLYHWLCGCSTDALATLTGWGSQKVTEWMKSIHQLIATVILNDDIQLGGPGVNVYIDESKFGKRKYNKGHRVEGAWVFGGVDDTRKVFALVVEKRNAKTLIPLIKKFIAKGSNIISDYHGGYNTIAMLKGYNYTHERVNHSKWYVDPITGVNTNPIEGTWTGMKKATPVRCRTKKQVQGCLFAFIWRRENEGNQWNGLIKALREVRYQ